MGDGTREKSCCGALVGHISSLQQHPCPFLTHIHTLIPAHSHTHTTPLPISHTHTCPFIYTHTPAQFTHIHTCLFKHTHTCLFTYTHLPIHTHTHRPISYTHLPTSHFLAHLIHIPLHSHTHPCPSHTHLPISHTHTPSHFTHIHTCLFLTHTHTHTHTQPARSLSGNLLASTVVVSSWHWRLDQQPQAYGKTPGLRTLALSGPQEDGLRPGPGSP